LNFLTLSNALMNQLSSVTFSRQLLIYFPPLTT
jgi:hypothetical protein